MGIDDCELIIPDAWRGKVSQGERLGETTLMWNGFYMLFARPCTPGEFLTYTDEVTSYPLADGASVTIRTGDDYAVMAEVTYGDGKGLVLYLHAYNHNSSSFFNKSDEECREYFALQAAAAGRSTDDDPKEVAIACLQVCVNNLRFS